MSTLLIRCPLKPFAGAFTGLAGEWEDLACAQRFEWCLVEDVDALSASTSPLSMQSGIGSIDSMPYANEALVLLPTLDVRLIETKVPLANPKKLQAILPTLLEEYVLSNTATMHISALPPVPGQSAMDRTLAAIDRAWFNWITSQLEHVLSSRVRLIPDCLL
jgi:type II secretory pathway component PulL